MGSLRTRTGLLLALAGGWVVAEITELTRPAGNTRLAITAMAATAVFGALVVIASRGERWAGHAIEWGLLVFLAAAIAGLIDLSADQVSSRAWFRFVWGMFLSAAAGLAIWWWPAEPPRSFRRLVGLAAVIGVFGAAGLTITVNCNETVSRSWCDRTYEREDQILAGIGLAGVVNQRGHLGGSGTGPAFARSLVRDPAPLARLVSFPEETGEPRPTTVRTGELEHVVATTESGCRIDAILFEPNSGAPNHELRVEVDCRAG